MADFDLLWDTKGSILNFIEQQARELFEGPTNEFNFPLWSQIALLFNEVIVPSKFYLGANKSLFELAQEVVDIAERHNCTVEMHQVKDGKKVNAQVWDYTDTITRIKAWLTKEVDELKRFGIF